LRSQSKGKLVQPNHSRRNILLPTLSFENMKQ